MTPFLLEYLCEPLTKLPLQLVDAEYDDAGNILSGSLVSPKGNIYPIVNGIPRFTGNVSTKSVHSFGEEWNHFNFIDFKSHWLNHTIANTFGSTDVFKDKIIVDAGGGSGSQSKWFAEYGAKHVILLELSHSVDGIASSNLRRLNNVDIIQCSVDAPPIRDGSIDGIVYCHNVIQHTPSVERTAKALFSLVVEGSEFVFNCYPKNTKGPFRWMRFHLIYKPLRATLSRMPFRVILAYAKSMAALRLIPIVGTVLEKLNLCIQGDVPRNPDDSFFKHLVHRYKAAALVTFDAYGSHSYQHHKSNQEIIDLILKLQPDSSKVINKEKYFERPQPIGCALRIFR